MLPSTKYQVRSTKKDKWGRLASVLVFFLVLCTWYFVLRVGVTSHGTPHPASRRRRTGRRRLYRGRRLAVPAHFGDPSAEYEHAHAGCRRVRPIAPRQARADRPRGRALSAQSDHQTSTILPLGRRLRSVFDDHQGEKSSRICSSIMSHAARRLGLLARRAAGHGREDDQDLDHFLISEQVEFADRTRDFAQMHLAGPKAQAVLEQRPAAACRL